IAVIPGTSIPEIGGFHGAVVVITAVDLGIAIVEATAGVIVETVNDPVLSLRLVIDCCAFHVVLAKSHSGLDENTVGFVSHDGNRSHVGEREVVKSAERRAAESTARRLREVVVLQRLVVNLGDPAVSVRAEFILSL